MLTFRRTLIISGLVLFLFFLYPKNNGDAKPKESSFSGIRGGGSPLSVEKKPIDEKRPKTEQIKISAKKQQQITIVNLKNLPLREQLGYQFPYQGSSKFPAFIWQTWKYAPDNSLFEERFRPFEASWTEKHPEFVHEVITDQVAVHLIKHLYGAIPDVVEAYEALPVPVLKADFFRYLILLARGGIYADIDTVALQPAVDWISSNFRTNSVGLVVGIEADPDRPDWKIWYSRRIQFCQWTIQAKPGHPVLREIVANITQTTLAMKKAGNLKITKQTSIVEWTGPALWSDVIFEYFNDPTYFDMSSSKGAINWQNFTGMKQPKKVGDVVVLPITSFSPGIGHSGAGGLEDPLAFVAHQFEGSWKPEWERHIGPEATQESGQKQPEEQSQPSNKS